MALEENIATPYCYFDCTGSIEILGRRDRDGEAIPLRCWRRWGHGPQPLNRAMENSCNIASVELGLMLGAHTFYKYIEAFGFFEEEGWKSGLSPLFYL